MKILVRREGAFGDVLDTTPVIRRLRQENPDAEIDIETAYPQVYAGSLHRIGLARDITYDRIINLDMAFENRLRKVGIVESYMEVAFGDRNGSTRNSSWLTIRRRRLIWIGPRLLRCIPQGLGCNEPCHLGSGSVFPIS